MDANWLTLACSRLLGDRSLCDGGERRCQLQLGVQAFAEIVQFDVRLQRGMVSQQEWDYHIRHGRQVLTSERGEGVGSKRRHLQWQGKPALRI